MLGMQLMGRLVRRAVRGLAVTIIGLGTFVVGAPRAEAHGTAGQAPVNFESVVLRVQPRVEGLVVEVTDLGQHVRVHAGTADVIVFDAAGDVERTIRAGTTQRWHDHRVHPMGGEPRESVPGFAWQIPLEVDGVAVTISGEVRFLDSPSPWPMLALGAAAGAVGWVATIRRPRAALLGVSTVLAVSTGALTIARWSASTESITSRVTTALWPALGALLLFVGAFRTLRRGVVASTAGLLFGFFGVTATVGLALLPWLSHARVPATGNRSLARIAVALALGLGASGVLATVRQLLRDSTNPGTDLSASPP